MVSTAIYNPVMESNKLVGSHGHPIPRMPHRVAGVKIKLLFRAVGVKEILSSKASCQKAIFFNLLKLVLKKFLKLIIIMI